MGQRLAAFLRGVNVGGNKRIDMASLRRVLEQLGLKEVGTVLQSGNAVFTLDRGDARKLGARIEGAIESEFGFTPKVITRTLHELERAMADDPLTDVAKDPARHLVGFLLGRPSKTQAAQAEAESTSHDLVRVGGDHLYMWCPEGISRSPLFKVNFDRILGTPVTMRNWNTVTKVSDLLRS